MYRKLLPILPILGVMAVGVLACSLTNMLNPTPTPLPPAPTLVPPTETPVPPAPTLVPPTGTPAPAGTPVILAPLFSEDFSNNSNDWFTGWENDTSYGDAYFQIASGLYRVRLTAMDDGFWTYARVPGFEGENYRISLDLTVTEFQGTAGNLSFELSLRDKSSERYVFVFRNDGTYAVFAYQNLEWVKIDQGDRPDVIRLQRGEPNNLSVSLQGDTFTITFNHNELAVVTDDRIHSSGEAYLQFGLLENGETAAFDVDNLIITEE